MEEEIINIIKNKLSFSIEPILDITWPNDLSITISTKIYFDDKLIVAEKLSDSLPIKGLLNDCRRICTG